MNDIECYVFPSDADARQDERNAEDDYKNILRDGSFTVKEEGDFILKFTGSNGKIKNICVNPHPTEVG